MTGRRKPQELNIDATKLLSMEIMKDS